MSKAKLLIAACFAMFIVGGIASATASAGEWDVNGKPITANVALASTALVLTTGKLAVPAANTEIVCKGHELLINEGRLLPPDGILAKDLTFHECSTENTGGCKIPTLTLTVALRGLAHLDGALNTLILVSPDTKNVLYTIKYEGELCALLGTQPVTGGLDLLIHEGRDPAIRHLILGFSLVAQLKIGSDEAELAGLSLDLELASKETWNFL
jgi:hypothetical protein